MSGIIQGLLSSIGGVQVQNPLAYDASTYNCYIGRSADGQQWFGRISNLRVTNTVVYSGASITPPTSQLTAIPGTLLLTCQNPTIVDNSPFSRAITTFGTVAANDSIIPFSGTFSYNFGTSGSNYLRLAPFDISTTNFTIEGFVYSSVNSGNGELFGISDSVANGTVRVDMQVNTINASTYYLYSIPSSPGGWISAVQRGNIPNNTWVHIAAVRSGNTMYLYVNGTRFNFPDVPI